MALGYEGYVSLQRDAIADVALGTGGGVPRAHQRLESSSGYGGQIKTPVAEMGIGLPRTYDWITYDGSLEFDVNSAFLDNQIKPWIFDRQDSAVVRFHTRSGNIQRFDNCFWSSISLSASEGSALSGSVGFVAVDRQEYTQGGDYIANKEGVQGFCDSVTGFDQPLNPFVHNLSPIPFWNTFVEVDGTLTEFLTWNLEFNQEVVKFFGCFNSATPQEPKFIGTGPMTVSFNGDYMPLTGVTAAFAVPDVLTSLYVTMGDIQIKTESLDLQSDSDVLQGNDAVVPISVEYAAYTLVA